MQDAALLVMNLYTRGYDNQPQGPKPVYTASGTVVSGLGSYRLSASPYRPAFRRRASVSSGKEPLTGSGGAGAGRSFQIAVAGIFRELRTQHAGRKAWGRPQPWPSKPTGPAEPRIFFFKEKQLPGISRWTRRSGSGPPEPEGRGVGREARLGPSHVVTLKKVALLTLFLLPARGHRSRH